MKKRLLLIDEKMNSVEIEISELNFRLLNIDDSKIKNHSKKRALNRTINDYLESFEVETDAVQD